MKTDHDSFLAYYLTQEDESAIKLKDTRASIAPYEIPEDQKPTLFQFVRDYETIKVEQNIDNEFLLLLWDGDPPLKFEDVIDDSDTKQPRREKGAYYKNIERKMLLKKKRVTVSIFSPLQSSIFFKVNYLSHPQLYEQYDDKWEVIRMTHAPISGEEEAERQEYLAEVSDPDYLLKMRTDADAEGEIEVDDMTFMNSAAAPVET
jgi:RNA polymerase II-associated factor 1